MEFKVFTSKFYKIVPTFLDNIYSNNIQIDNDAIVKLKLTFLVSLQTKLDEPINEVIMITNG